MDTITVTLTADQAHEITKGLMTRMSQSFTTDKEFKRVKSFNQRIIDKIFAELVKL